MNFGGLVRGMGVSGPGWDGIKCLGRGPEIRIGVDDRKTPGLGPPAILPANGRKHFTPRTQATKIVFSKNINKSVELVSNSE